MRFLNVGQIVNVHGIRGQVKVYPYTDDIENLSKKKFFYLSEDEKSIINVEKASVQKNMLLIKFKNVDSVEEAENFRGKNIYIMKDELEKLEEGSYYIDDLIDCEVIDIDDNSLVGKLVYVFNTGANDVYEIENLDGKKIYIPAIKQVIKKVDIDSKKIYVKIMEGLL